LSNVNGPLKARSTRACITCTGFQVRKSCMSRNLTTRPHCWTNSILALIYQTHTLQYQGCNTMTRCHPITWTWGRDWTPRDHVLWWRPRDHVLWWREQFADWGRRLWDL